MSAVVAIGSVASDRAAVLVRLAGVRAAGVVVGEAQSRWWQAWWRSRWIQAR